MRNSVRREWAAWRTEESEAWGGEGESAGEDERTNRLNLDSCLHLIKAGVGGNKTVPTFSKCRFFFCFFFNTPYACNDGKECNLTNTPLANRPAFVLQMRTSCSNRSSPTNGSTKQGLEGKAQIGP